MEESVDRISDLPSELILLILSFLPIKEAIATSLLSKSWKTFWLSLPTLYLNSEHFQRLTFFGRFIDKVHKLVDLKSVKKIVLKCHSYERHENFRHGKINKWINVAISKNVEHVELNLQLIWWRSNPYKLPSGLFIANNIRVLKLDGEEIRIGTLSHVNFPLIEVLHLKGVVFSDLRSLEMLLNACPLLKDLEVRFQYRVDYHHPLNIGRLNHLITAEVPQSLIPLEAFSNATFLRFINEVMCPLTFSDDIPMFNNLTHLECVADEWTKMVNLLHNFPKLEKLVIGKLGSSSPPEPILDVPPCVSSHLKEFTILHSKRSESESEMVKFMMKNARVLRTVHVCAGLSLLRNEPPEFRNLAAYLRLGSERWSRTDEQPLVLMLSS